MRIRRYLTLCAFLCVALLSAESPASEQREAENVDRVRQAFEDWRQGRGSVFELLAEDAEWTVAGNSPVSGRYRGRQALMEQAVAPIQARLATPIVPTVRQVMAQDDQVMVLWDGTAQGKDGRRYENSYAWHMVLKEGRIVKVVAYLDTWRLVKLLE